METMIKENSKFLFYFLEENTSTVPIYRYQAISLALGLQKKQMKFYSNINYWKCLTSGEYLFKKKNKMKVNDFDFVIFNCQYFAYGGQLPDFMKKKEKPISILIDVCDGLFGVAESENAKYFDIILKQKNNKLSYASNVKSPWVYGLSDHLNPLFKEKIKFKQKKKEINVSYRHIHSSRKLANEKFIEYLKKEYNINTSTESLSKQEENLADILQELYIQARKRHHLNYINRIKNAQIIATFGGFFSMKFIDSNQKRSSRFAPYIIKGRGGGRLSSFLEKINIQKKHTYSIYQWDSYRLWESFAAQSVVLNVDFEKYGIEFPVMPQNWKDYIGIDLNNTKKDIDRFLSLSDKELEDIAKNGYVWANLNYSSEAQADRLLKIINSNI